MNFADLIVHLRSRTAEACQSNDEPRLKQLVITLNDIADAIEASGDWTYWEMVDDLIDSIRHIGIAPFKVHIPAEEDIRRIQPK